MVFQNPHMLIGLAAMLVPLVLHFLNRARYRNVDWGAMMFLDGTDGKNIQSSKLKQYGLLILRSVMIGLFALAMARPVLHLQGRPAMESGRAAAVILLDRSASMSLNDNGRVRLDMAREAVFQLLSPGFHRGDDLWLIPMGVAAQSSNDLDGLPDAGTEIFTYASDPQDMARHVKEVTMPAGHADVARSILQGLQLLATSEAPNPELYIVTDNQAESWKGIDEQFLQRFKELKSQLAYTPRIIAMPIGSDLTENIYVESITVKREPLVKDRLVDVEIKVRNDSPVPRAVVPMTIEVQSPNGSRKVVRTTSIDLPPRATSSLIAPISFADGGSNVIVARITAPGLVSDKELQLSVDVINDFKILVVDGDEQEGGGQSGAEFIKLAASPFEKTSKKNLAKVVNVRPDGWNPADLAEYQVLILCNVPALSEAESDAIERFVYDGGGLLIAPGDQSRTESLNASMRWLSARLSAAGPDSDAGSTQVSDLELTHPVFRYLDQQILGNLPLVRRYFPVTIAPVANAGGAVIGGTATGNGMGNGTGNGMGAVNVAGNGMGSVNAAGSEPAVIGRYADGYPFLIESKMGSGRVLILTTPIDPEWNSLPLSGMFPSFVKGMLGYLGSGGTSNHSQRCNVLTGQPISVETDESMDPATVAVLGPMGRQDATAIAVTQHGLRSSIVFRNTKLPGIYRVLPKGVNDAAAIQFVVRTPAAESDLTPVSALRWKELESLLGMERINPDLRAASLSQEQSRAGMDLWLPLLGAGMILAILELAFCRYWSKGE